MKRIINCLVLIAALHMIDGNAYAQWTKSTFPDSAAVTDLLFDINTLYVTTYGGGVFKSQSFDTWTSSNNGITTLNINKIITAIEGPITTLYAATDSGVFRSTSMGNIWIAVNNGLTNRNVGTIYSDGTNLYVGTANGAFKSSNYGLTWLPMSIGAPTQIVKTYFKNGTDLLAGLINVGQYIYKSTDQGLTWVPYGSGNYETTQIDKLGNELFAVSGTLIYRSIDNGATWTPVGPGLVPGMTVSDITTGNNHWWVSTYAGGFIQHTDSASFKKITNGMPSGGLNLSAVARNGIHVVFGTISDGIWYAFESAFTGVEDAFSGNEGLNISPNPTSGVVSIRSAQLQNADWEYSIYDLSGKCIISGSATGECFIDISRIPDGYYLINIKTDNEFFTRKLLKL